MNVLFILTSHDQLGSTGEKTGFWLEEFTSPYYYLIDKGVSVSLASPEGGQPPLDPKSDDPGAQTDSTKRFAQDKDTKQKLANTHVLSTIDASEFDAVFYPGGHGPLWDLCNDQTSIQLIEKFLSENKPVAAVCHAPAVLINVKDSNGLAAVAGKQVTGFSNTEEEAVQLTDIVPFLLEDTLTALGANYTRINDWEAFAVTDGNLITGQNPASSEMVAEHLYDLLQVNA